MDSEVGSPHEGELSKRRCISSARILNELTDPTQVTNTEQFSVAMFSKV